MSNYHFLLLFVLNARVESFFVICAVEIISSLMSLSNVENKYSNCIYSLYEYVILAQSPGAIENC